MADDEQQSEPTPDTADISDMPETTSATTTPAMVEPDVEGAVPPGYDWPTHGGYLGCLLGQMPACLVGGFLGSTLFNALNQARIVPGWAAALLTVATFILGMILFGRIGWVLGKRFYRAYPQPVPTWGESDAIPGEGAEQSKQSDERA